MPAVPEPYDAVAAQIDRIAPRHPDVPLLNARQPAIDYAAIALDAPNSQPVAKRQQQLIIQGIIPTYYNLSGPAPGTVVGLVLGSVAGFLLVVWLLFVLTQGGGFGAAGRSTSMAGQEEIVVRRRRNSHGAGGGRSRVSRRTVEARETREISRSPRRSGGGGRSTILVEERRGPRPRSIIVEERHRVPGDDVVEVIEERDEYRERRGSRRGSGYRY